LFDHGLWQNDAQPENDHFLGIVFGELMASVPVWAEIDRPIVFLVWETFTYDSAQRHQYWIDFGCLLPFFQRNVGGG
jgi:hypothetical protein